MEDTGASSDVDFGDSLGDATSVLVHSPSIGGLRSSHDLPAFLPPGVELADSNVLAVTYSQSAQQWLSNWRTSVGVLPRRMLVVDATEGTRSTTAVSDGGQSPPGPGPDSGAHSIETVSPEDLTGLGITLGDPLSKWSSDPTLVGLDSLTAMLQYVDLQRAFRFLHVFTRRLGAVGGRGVFFIDPDAHDDREMATLRPLFDTVVVSDDTDGTPGNWRVERP